MQSTLNTLAAGEISDGQFLGYVAALAVSGVILLVLAALPLGASTGSRVLNGLIGLAMLGYAFYLFFIFEGGEVRIFFYVFVVPVLLIVQTFKSIKEKREEREQAQAQMPAQAQPQPQTPAQPQAQDGPAEPAAK